MKTLMNIGFLLTLTLFASQSEASTYIKRPGAGGYVVRTRNGAVYIPPTEKKEEPKGVGNIYRATVQVTKVQVGEVMEDQYSAWVGGCGKVDLPAAQAKSQGIINGDFIELRFQQAGQCTVTDWKKY